MPAIPYFLPDFPGIGGKLKQRPEDFFVQEIPAYEPSGEGEHVYCEIQKVGITTLVAVNRIAGALGVSTRDVGYAGLKDAQAITRQTLSIWGTTEEHVMGMRVPGVTVLWARRHGNKLRIGHLYGNRFAIKVRDVDPSSVVRVQQALDVLTQRGMPNFFGTQRFGRRGDNDALGEALLHGNHAGVLRHLLGMPMPGVDNQHTLRARDAFDKRDNQLALQLWPRTFGLERRVLARLIHTNKPAVAVKSIDERIRRLWVSALQSRIFNDVVAARVDQIDRVMTGDMAYKHENGACFYVEDEAAENARAAAFEISATGPLLGYRMSLPKDKPLELEQRVFAAHKINPADFKDAGRHKMKGARRPIRVRPTDVRVEGGVDEAGPHVTVAFTLPSGSFATVLMRELMKNDEAEWMDESRAARPEASTAPSPGAPDAHDDADIDSPSSDPDEPLDLETEDDQPRRAAHPLFGHNAPDIDDEDDE